MDKVTSLGNARVEKSDNPAHWTPVECLRQLLADIESGGVDAERVVVVIQGKLQPGGIRNTGYYQASPEHSVSIGMLTLAAHQIAVDAEIRDYVEL